MKFFIALTALLGLGLSIRVNPAEAHAPSHYPARTYKSSVDKHPHAPNHTHAKEIWKHHHGDHNYNHGHAPLRRIRRRYVYPEYYSPAPRYIRYRYRTPYKYDH